MKIYKHPLYYEIAFSFIDVKSQIDGFEKLIEKFSKHKVRRFLDIACGPSLQLREIAKRGYEAVGLDLVREMIDYLEQKAKEDGTKIEGIRADMNNFKLDKKVDFAFIMMGSFVFQSNKNLLSHLDSVAGSLKKGGLYFIQNLSLDWSNSGKQSWTIKKDGIIVKTTYERTLKNIPNQIFVEKIIFDINDRGKKQKLIQARDIKFVFPQELKTLIELNGKFEFLGWWKGNNNKNWPLDVSLEKAKNLNGNFVLLRRK